MPLGLKFNVNLDFTSEDYNIVSIERFRVSVQVDGVIGLERNTSTFMCTLSTLVWYCQNTRTCFSMGFVDHLFAVRQFLMGFLLRKKPVFHPVFYCYLYFYIIHLLKVE